MLDWLIIGGGIHGTHLAFALTQHGVPKDRLRVLDPQPRLLSRWQHVTTNTGMAYLRSPMMHHLHTDPRALGVFARIHDKADYTRFIPTFSRPSLELFNRHCQYLIDKYQLDKLHLQASAQRLDKIESGWRVSTNQGSIEARRVVFAIGMNDSLLAVPDWAASLRADGLAVHHLFDPSFHLDDIRSDECVAIIGGGISAAQSAIALAVRGAAVTLITRHPARIHDFDSDPCWQNATCLRDFHKIDDFDRRREIINSARNRGSMPPDVATALYAIIASGQILYFEDNVQSVNETDGKFQIQSGEEKQFTVDRVLLATGWQRQRPGGALIDYLMQDYSLPTAQDGFPVLSRDLCWHQPGLHVTGALAELEIGPTARNIIGARLVGQRLVPMIS